MFTLPDHRRIRDQVEQAAPGSVVVRIVSTERSSGLRNAIRELVAARLGGMTCDIEELDQILPLPSGKTPVVLRTNQ